MAFLSRQEYKLHNKIVEELLETLEAGILLFPYQIASVLEVMVQLHPEDSKTIASRIRRFALGGNLQKKSDWLVVQKCLEVLVTYPYKEKYITKIALHFVKHEHPMVRRPVT